MRHKRIRALVKGTNERPRLSVFRSNKHLYLQLIDDQGGITLLACSDASGTSKPKKKKDEALPVERAELLGEELAKASAEKNITDIVFDRSGYRYHGIIKAVAQGARKGGLTF